MRDDVPLGALAERVRALSAALPRACARHAFELVVERPGLLTTGRVGDARGDRTRGERPGRRRTARAAVRGVRAGVRARALARGRARGDAGGVRATAARVGRGRGRLASRLHAENRERVGVLVDARTNGDERDGGERRRVSGTRRPGRASRFGRAPISARARRRRMTDATTKNVDGEEFCATNENDVTTDEFV